MARTTSNGDEDVEQAGFRISLTIEPSLRKKMRIAAAIHDMTVGEWAAAVLERAADKAVPQLPKVTAE